MQQLLEKAIFIALTAHSGKTDKGGNPYILHSLRIMLSMETIEEKIVAILHDVIEDSTTTISELKTENFPPQILTAVSLLTKKENQSYQDYILEIKKNHLATIVKLADLADNMNTNRLKIITEADNLRIKKYKTAIKILTAPNYP